MISIIRYLKIPPYGVLLYGIPPLSLLVLFVLPLGHSHLNSVQHSLTIGTSISFFIISTVLGAFVDNYFRSDPEASFFKIVSVGSFAWSFLVSASVLFVGYIAFKTYDTNHHTSFLPQVISSNLSTLLVDQLQGTFFGGIFILPLNGLFAFLVRRHYRNQTIRSSPAS